VSARSKDGCAGVTLLILLVMRLLRNLRVVAGDLDHAAIGKKRSHAAFDRSAMVLLTPP
jgi:hypothetical protein